MNIVRGTFWPKLTEVTGQPLSSSIEGIARRCERPLVSADKFALPGWSFATFRDHRRALANLLYVYAVVLDIDHDSPSFDDVVRALEKSRAIIHTSFSHRPEFPRLRIVLLVSRPMTREEFPRVWSFVTRVMASTGVQVDAKAKDGSRLFFVPAVPPGGELHYRTTLTAGELLDVDAALAAETPAPATPPAAPPSLPRVSLLDRIERARRYLDTCDPAISGQGGHATTFAVAQKLVRGFELSVDVAFELLAYHYNPRCQPPWSERELRRKCAEAARAGRMAHGALSNARRTG